MEREMPYQFIKKSFTALILSGLSVSSLAIDTAGFTTKLSTLGVGAAVNVTLFDNFEAFGGLNLYDFDFDIDENKVGYKGLLNMRTLSTGGRFHPFSSGLYVGGGVNINQNEINLTVKPKNNRYTFNENNYNAEAVNFVKARGTFNNLAPMFMLGWESKNVNEKGFSFFGEVGMFFGGAPRLEADIICSGRCGGIADDFEVEMKAIEKKLKHFRTYPILGAGVHYRF